MDRTRGMSLETPAEGLYLIRVRGELDEGAGARLLRLIDARLQINELGLRPGRTRHILIDLTAASGASRAGLAALSRARHTTQRRRIGLALIGAGALACQPGDPGARARALLGPLACYPDTTAAVTALQHQPHPANPAAHSTTAHSTTGHGIKKKATTAPTRSTSSTAVSNTPVPSTAEPGTSVRTGADEP